MNTACCTSAASRLLPAGQASDEYFEHARSGRLKVVVGPAKLIDGAGVHLKDGRVLPADMVCYCGGFEFQSSPPFLAELGLGETLNHFSQISSKFHFSSVPATKLATLHTLRCWALRMHSCICTASDVLCIEAEGSTCMWCEGWVSSHKASKFRMHHTG